MDLGVQIARGLAAAHESGIVHRDLKPENVVLTKDGRAKILDFGLAKQRAVTAGEDTKSPTLAKATDAGTLLGTVGYMAPEQVRGQPADARSDIFAFGCVLFEMLTGKRAFKGDSAIETMNAILKEEPAEPDLSGAKIPSELDRLVRHCLEKNPAERFQSARDLAFDLEAVAGSSATGRAPAPASSRGGRRWVPAAAVAIGVLVAAASYAFGHWRAKRSNVAVASFAQLTFRQEPIFKARLAPDGKTVVYSAAASGNTPEIFSLRSDYPGASPRSLRAGHLLSISSKGELAILTGARYKGHSLFEGTLARMPLEGGAPREILDGVREAEWAPDGGDLAVIRDVGGKDRLEFPAGKVLAETGGYFSDPRFSPRGDRIAFFQHPFKFDDRGEVAVVDLAGRKTILSEGYWGEQGLAWSQAGDEVMFSAGNAYNNFRVYAVSLAGKRRVALESAGGLTIHDIRADGRWLTTRDDFFREMQVLAPGQPRERDLSWLDLSDPAALSADGRHSSSRKRAGASASTTPFAFARRTGRLSSALEREVPAICRVTGGGHSRTCRRRPRSSCCTRPAPASPASSSAATSSATSRRTSSRTARGSSSAVMRTGGPSGATCRTSRAVRHAPSHRRARARDSCRPTAGRSSSRRAAALSCLIQRTGARRGPWRVRPPTIRSSGGAGAAAPCSSRAAARSRRASNGSTSRRASGKILRTVGPVEPHGRPERRARSPSPNDLKSYAYACRRMSSHLFLVEGAR